MKTTNEQSYDYGNYVYVLYLTTMDASTKVGYFK